MMSLNVQIETLLAIEKILHGFLWKGHKDVHGGHCLVAWHRSVCRRSLVVSVPKPSEDEPCASGAVALVESSGGLSVVERVSKFPRW
jgi:hypothetical protein